MKNQNITIVLLIATSALLIGILLATYAGTSSPDAQASGTTVKGGDYIMCTAAWTNSEDLLYVIDVVARKMNVYAFNSTNKTIEMLPKGQADLKLLFK